MYAPPCISGFLSAFTCTIGAAANDRIVGRWLLATSIGAVIGDIKYAVQYHRFTRGSVITSGRRYAFITVQFQTSSCFNSSGDRYSNSEIRFSGAAAMASNSRE